MIDNFWWKKNKFKFSLDDWASLTKSISQANFDEIWNKLTEKQQQEDWEKILEALKFSDFGRYGYSYEEAKIKSIELKNEILKLNIKNK